MAVHRTNPKSFTIMCKQTQDFEWHVHEDFDHSEWYQDNWHNPKGLKNFYGLLTYPKALEKYNQLLENFGNLPIRLIHLDFAIGYVDSETMRVLQVFKPE